MKFEAVIFDMDGVLIDSEPLHVNIETSMFKEFNIPLKKEMYTRFAGTTSLSMWKTLVKEFHIDLKPEELASASNNRFINELKSSKEVKLFNGVVDVLTNLHTRNIPVALASSSSMEIINAVLDKFNLHQFFAVIVSGSDVQHSKPHPEIFLTASQNLKIVPSKCVVVEDSPNGVNAAHLSGMKCIGFASEKNQHDISHATWIMKSFNEFDFKLFNICVDCLNKKENHIRHNSPQ